MRTPRPHDRRPGVVVSFDAHVGLGSIEVDLSGGRMSLHVHCTEIDGGSRRLVPGTTVDVALAAGHAGRWEAVDVRAPEGSFLCAVCGASVPGVRPTAGACAVCGWTGGPDAASGAALDDALDDARRAWRERNP